MLRIMLEPGVIKSGYLGHVHIMNLNLLRKHESQGTMNIAEPTSPTHIRLKLTLIKAICSNTYQLQFTKLHHFKLERFKLI